MSELSPLYVTIHGLPLRFDLEWPFHPSTSGADFEVLHGTIWLVGESGLRADVAVHVAQTVREALPSLAPEHSQNVVINALRKQVDNKQLEFLRSGKRQPVPLSARFMNFRTKQWQFVHASDGEIELMLRDRVYWTTKTQKALVPVTDPCELMYLGANEEKFRALAARLAHQHLIHIDGERACATELLLALKPEIEKRRDTALEQLLQKHAFEQMRAS